MEVEIGRGKKGRRAYGFDDIAIVPSRRTRDPDDIDIAWTLGPYRFELPLLASAMDGVVSPTTAGIVGKLGGLAVLNLEGIFTRYEDAEEQLERIAGLPKDIATAEMQRVYAEPVKEELIAQRIREIKDQRSWSPPRSPRSACASTTRPCSRPGSTSSSSRARSSRPSTSPSSPSRSTSRSSSRRCRFPVVVGGCASYSTGLHLMRTGAVGVLVGVGPGAACTTRGVLGIGVPAGHRDRRRPGRALAAHAGDRRVLQRHRRRRHAQRRRHLEGLRLRRRRRDDRLAARARLRGAGPRLPLGHGHLPSRPAARRPREDHPERLARADPERPRARERRHVQPHGLRCARRWPPAATRTSRPSTAPR